MMGWEIALTVSFLGMLVSFFALHRWCITYARERNRRMSVKWGFRGPGLVFDKKNKLIYPEDQERVARSNDTLMAVGLVAIIASILITFSAGFKAARMLDQEYSNSVNVTMQRGVTE